MEGDSIGRGTPLDACSNFESSLSPPICDGYARRNARGLRCQFIQCSANFVRINVIGVAGTSHFIVSITTLARFQLLGSRLLDSRSSDYRTLTGVISRPCNRSRIPNLVHNIKIKFPETSRTRLRRLRDHGPRPAVLRALKTGETDKRDSVRRVSAPATIPLGDHTRRLTRRAAASILRRLAPLFGLAPIEVYRAVRVSPNAGGLLPHRFTLARRHRRAVCSLWHFLWVTPGSRTERTRSAEPICSSVSRLSSPVPHD